MVDALKYIDAVPSGPAMQIPDAGVLKKVAFGHLGEQMSKAVQQGLELRSQFQEGGFFVFRKFLVPIQRIIEETLRKSVEALKLSFNKVLICFAYGNRAPISKMFILLFERKASQRWRGYVFGASKSKKQNSCL